MSTQRGLVIPLISGAILTIAASFGILICWGAQTASQIGDLFSGIAGTAAFLCLVAGFYLQSRELRLQREELQMQRESLNLQKEEVRKIAKLSALQQIAAMLKDFNASLPAKKLPNVVSVDDLPNLWLYGIANYSTPILKGADPGTVHGAYGKWQAIEWTCRQFISTVVTAINLYSEATGDDIAVTGENATYVISTNHQRLLTIPFLQQYMPPAIHLATDMFIVEGGALRMHLAGLEALNTLVPGACNQEELAKLRARVGALRPEPHTNDIFT